MANKANKINKRRIDETFDSLRYVDKMFNKAGGVLTESKKPISLEEKLKRSILKESEDGTGEVNIDFVDSEGQETEFNFELEDGQIVDLDTDFDLDEIGEESSEEDLESEEELESEETEEGEEDLETEESEEGEEEVDLESEFGSEEELEGEEELDSEEELNEYNELQPSGEYGGVQSTLNPHDEMSEEELEEAVNNLMMEADELEDNNPLEGETTETGMMDDDGTGAGLDSENGELDTDLEGGEEGLDSEEGMEDDFGDEFGGGSSMGGMSSGPSMGMGDDTMGGEASPELAASTSLSSPQDIDQLINSIVDETPLTENKELKALGYQDLKDKELIGNKVKMESVKRKNIKALTEAIQKRTGKKVVFAESTNQRRIKALTEAIQKRTGKKVVFKENDQALGNGFKASTKLADRFGRPGSVEGSSATQERPNHAAKAKVVKSVGGYTLMDLGEEDFNGSAPAQANTVKKVNADGDFKTSKLKEESVMKNKALLNLADKYVTLNESHEKLILENYKLKKANSLLTVLPELNETTKLQIIKKFDSCKSLKEAKELYVSVTKMLKEHSGVSSSVRNLNEAVIKRSNGTAKFLGESMAGPSNFVSDELANPDADAQRRIDLLSGFGNEDDYGVGAY